MVTSDSRSKGGAMCLTASILPGRCSGTHSFVGKTWQNWNDIHMLVSIPQLLESNDIE